MIVETQKRGNLIVIPLPSSLGIKEGEEFYILKKDSGVITLIPKIKDPFEYAKAGEFYIPEDLVEYIPTETEIGNW